MYELPIKSIVRDPPLFDHLSLQPFADIPSPGRLASSAMTTPQVPQVKVRFSCPHHGSNRRQLSSSEANTRVEEQIIGKLIE
jgi:hypothetical protein